MHVPSPGRMLIPMSRSQRTYNHRLVRLVQDTGDIVTVHGIRSRAG